jgi:hypothetical protein
LLIRKALLDSEQPVVGVDDELGRGVFDVGHVTLDAGERPRLGFELSVTLLVPPDSWMNRLRLTGILPATAFAALATCSSMPLSVLRARSCLYW